MIDVRSDFPLLLNEDVVYFDNACMTLRPQQVIDSISHYYTHLSACAGRSNHHLSHQVHVAVEDARKVIADFIDAKESSEILFTRNTTEGINLIAHSMQFKAGDVVLISDKEHNSNLVPWLHLQEKESIVVKVVPSTSDNQTDIDAWKEKFEEGNVVLASFVYTSNLDGVTNQVKEIISLAHRYGAKTLVDAAQAAPHQPISVRKLDVDFLAFSAHKLCGPSGMGALYGKKKLLEQLSPFMLGGDTVAQTSYDSYELLPLPERFEAGLQDYAGIIGFGAAVSYIQTVGIHKIHDHEVELTKHITEGLTSFDRVTLIGPNDPNLRGGITSFYVKGADHHQIALMLDQMGSVEVRSGQHCVHSWFTAKNLPGSVRASVYFYNTLDDAHRFLDTFTKIMKVV